MTLVVEPPPAVPTVTLNGVRAAIIYMSWLHDGRVESQEPSSPVEWAIVSTSNDEASRETIFLDTSVAPASLELRFFQALGEDLTPVGEGTVQQCSVQSSASCRYSSVPGGTNVDLVLPVDTVAIVLAGQWYIPVSERENVPGISDVDIVSWGFRFLE